MGLITNALSKLRERIAYQTPEDRAAYMKQQAAKRPRQVPFTPAETHCLQSATAPVSVEDSPAPLTSETSNDSQKQTEMPTDVSDRYEPQPTKPAPNVTTQRINLYEQVRSSSVQSLMDAAKPHAS